MNDTTTMKGEQQFPAQEEFGVQDNCQASGCSQQGQNLSVHSI
jgi:hypothetical protein